MNEFSIRSIHAGRLHISLVRNVEAGRRCTRTYRIRLDRMRPCFFLTLHARSWFLNMDWVR